MKKSFFLGFAMLIVELGCFFRGSFVLAATSFVDNLNGYKIQNFVDGSVFGKWTDQFGGYGTVGIENDGKNQVLSLSPAVSASSGETHASLVTGASFSGAQQMQAKMYTVQQLRTGSKANPWETGWVIWNYSDNEHFYYFIPKTNGWELGKRDPAYPGGQRFLATGSNIKFPIKQWYTVNVSQDASNQIIVTVNGKKITTFVDTERPYTSGAVGFYSEDAHVHFDDVSANSR